MPFVAVMTVILGVVITSLLAQESTEMRSQAASVDNCCFGSRTCSTNQEWTDGYYACQRHECSVCQDSAPPTNPSSGSGSGTSQSCTIWRVQCNNGEKVDGDCGTAAVFSQDEPKWKNQACETKGGVAGQSTVSVTSPFGAIPPVPSALAPATIPAPIVDTIQIKCDSGNAGQVGQTCDSRGHCDIAGTCNPACGSLGEVNRRNLAETAHISNNYCRSGWSFGPKSKGSASGAAPAAVVVAPTPPPAVAPPVTASTTATGVTSPVTAPTTPAAPGKCPARIAAVGDSITIASYVAQLRVLCGSTTIIKNEDGDPGTSQRLSDPNGDKFAQIGKHVPKMAADFDTVLAWNPDMVIILGGTNDVAGGSVSYIQSNLASMYDRARSSGAQVVAVTIPPWKNADQRTPDTLDNIRNLNAWILNDAPADERVNIYDSLVAPGTDDADPHLFDGMLIHPVGAGSSIVSQEIFSAITTP